MNPKPTFLSVLVALLLLCSPATRADDTVRPEVGKPLQAAQELIKAGRYKDALARLKELDSVAGKTSYEMLVLERMRGAAAAGAGDNDTAAKSLEAVIAANKLPAAEQLKTYEALIGTYYRARDYARVVATGRRYGKDGGSNSQIGIVVVQAQYLMGDYSGAAKDLRSILDDDEKAGRTPTEEQLQLLANCYARLNDNGGYVATLEKLLTLYPKRNYWPDILSRIQRKPGFSDRYSLDAYRLMYAAGALNETGDYVDMAQLALQSGQPAEAKKIIDDGFAKGILGAGSDAARHARLRDLTVKQLAVDSKAFGDNERQAKTPDAMANVGYAYVLAGQVDKGLALMEKANALNGIKRPGETRLHLAEAYRIAGSKEKALQAFKSVEGNDGAADIARLWVLLISHE